MLAVMLEANARFSLMTDARPPSASESNLLFQFELPTGLRVASVDKDRIIIIDRHWFEKAGFHLVVGPNLYRTAGPGEREKSALAELIWQLASDTRDGCHQSESSTVGHQVLDSFKKGPTQ